MLKKILFSLGAIVALFCTIISCSKDEIYSCDPIINKWTKSNLKSIKSMTRANFVEVNDIERQRAIYNAFTPEQRINIWLGKINDIQQFNWSEDEQTHLEGLKSIINAYSKIFGGDETVTQEENDAFELDIYRWIYYAETTLNWSKKLIGNVIYTPLTIADKEGNLAYIPENSPMAMHASEGGTTPVCQCAPGDWACPGTCTTTLACRRVEMGCGRLWNFPCTGMCVR